jgi:hypothetical protein
VAGWGAKPDLTFYMKVNTAPLSSYRNHFKLMLILRTIYANIDRMADTYIEKSAPFTIVPNSLITIAIPRPSRLQLSPSEPNEVEFNLVLLPNEITANNIESLSDIEKFGGRILATPSAAVEFQK